MPRCNFRHVLLAGLAMFLGVRAGSARADELRVAVAANFFGTLQKLAPLFARAQGHTLLVSPGASGQLYAQIERGAPYDVLLSADSERPKRLEREGLALPGTRFTYAIGRLVLWSRKPGYVDAQGKVLTRADLRFVALADPKTAPYGRAGEQVLSALGLLAPLRAASKLAYGESVGQAHQFAATGHADCAFVALSQVRGEGGEIRGSYWLVPSALYARLGQDAIALRTSHEPALARAFLAWLQRDPQALATIRAAGYGVPGASAK